MTITEFENTGWTTGMWVEVNGIKMEVASVNVTNNYICVMYDDRLIWLPCSFVNLVKK